MNRFTKQFGRALLYGLPLGLLGFVGNWLRIPLFFNFDFLLGSIVVILVARSLGVFPALIASLVASAETYFLWNHPYAMLSFTCEAVFVGYWHQRRKANIVLLDGIYWVVIGMPLVWLCYYNIMGIPHSLAALAILKQTVNGIFNALTAGLLIILVQSVLVRTGRRAEGVPFRSVLFDIMVASVLVPGLVFVIASVRTGIREHEEATLRRLENAFVTAKTLLPRYLVNRMTVGDVGDSAEIKAVMQAIVGRQPLAMYLCDDNQRLIATVQKPGVDLPVLPRPQTESRRKLGGGLYQWVAPARVGMPFFQRWENSFYGKQARLDEAMPWTLIVEESMASHVIYLNGISNRGFFLLVVLTIAAIMVAHLLSRNLVDSLSRLSGITQNLPARLPKIGDIAWPRSVIGEVGTLIRNFRQTAGELERNFVALEEAKQLLERRVEERTIELKQEVEAHQKAEKALRESERRMELALRGADLGMWDWNIITGKTIFNERWAGMLGYSLDEINPAVTAWENLIHPDDLPSVMEALRAHLERKTDYYETEHRLKHKTGEWVWILDRGRVIERDTEGRPLRACGTHLDITDRKRAEEEHRQLEAQLRQSQKLEAVGQLAGGVAHDFNNLLTVIQGNIDLGLADLRKALGPDHDVVKCLEQVEQSARRAALLTRQLLTFSRRDIMQPTIVNLNRVVSNLADMLSRLITENIVYEAIICPDLRPVRADVGQLEQMIVNLVLNAVQAMPDGGRLTLETRNVTIDEDYVHHHAEAKPGPYVCLAVSDTGHGMDAATCERIFEPFFTTKAPDKGSGLGLSIVHGIVKRSGGHVMVYSEPGRGATFKIYLPALATAPAEPSPSAPPDVLALGQGTILLCEDDPAVRGMIEQSLKSAGYRVLAVGTGREAVEVAQRNAGTINLLITDVIMPDMNGRELHGQLHAACPAMPTLFISGYTSNIIAHHGVLDDDVNFLEKPFTSQALLAKVAEILAQSPPRP